MNVVITGASAGLGRALTRTFARHGHAVLAVARRSERLQELSREMAAEGAASVFPLSLDITSPGAAGAILAEARRRFGTVHILINNAGVSPYQTFRELSHGHREQILAVNVRALTELCHLFLEHMEAHGEPSRVVNVGSVGGYAVIPNFAVYSGTKSFVRSFTNVLHYEYRKTSIRVCALHPGGMMTEFEELCGQRVKPFGYKNLMSPDRMAERCYPRILKGRRLILVGFVNYAGVFLGKILPFPWVIRMTRFAFDLNVEKIAPTYPPWDPEEGAAQGRIDTEEGSR